MTDDRVLMDELARHPFARAALVHLDRAWPGSATLDIFTLGAGTDERAFAGAVQWLLDLGLIQYELVLTAGERTVYRYAAITQHGREIVRALRVS